MSENTESGRVSIQLQQELEALLKNPTTIGERIDYIINENRRLGVENQVLKLWIVELLSSVVRFGDSYDSLGINKRRKSIRPVWGVF